MLPASSSASQANCDTLQTSAITTVAIDPAALAGVTSVTVLDVSACVSLTDLTVLSGNALADVTTNAQVQAALQSTGQVGAEVVGYTLEGTSLTVYIRARH
jgi:hypothetical protein